MVTFENINVEVDGQAVEKPVWKAEQMNPACHSNATVVDSSTIKFTWHPRISNKTDESPVSIDRAMAAMKKAAKAPKKWTPEA